MTDPQVETLIENEKEWRRYLVTKLDEIDDRVSAMRAWSLVYRLSGMAAFSLLCIWIESKLK